MSEEAPPSESMLWLVEQITSGGRITREQAAVILDIVVTTMAKHSPRRPTLRLLQGGVR